MKQIISLFLFFLFVSGYCQEATNTNRCNNTNVYNQALSKYLNSLRPSRTRKFDTLYVLYDLKLTDSLVKNIDGTKILVLNNEMLDTVIKKCGNIVLLVLYPIEYIKNEFIISFVPFTVRKDEIKNELNFINPGPVWVIFKFQNNRFKFMRVQSHGI